MAPGILTPKNFRITLAAVLDLNYHIPVMLTECIDGLNIKPDGTYVDATYGGGGHSSAILDRLGPQGRLVAFDQDEDALNNVKGDNRLYFINQNFEYLRHHLRYLGIDQLDGVLADLGISSHQIDTPDRGFSIRFDAELDMRMNKNHSLTAKRILNTYSEEALQRMFGMYGEVQNARTLAQTIAACRQQRNIETVFQFKELILPCVPKWKDNQYYAQVFQALRIEVNNELFVLQKFLQQSVSLLDTGGRLVVLSYHSLEDRLVKNFISKGNFSGDDEKDFFGNRTKVMVPVNKKPILAGAEELEINPRSRSAKLRIGEKL